MGYNYLLVTARVKIRMKVNYISGNGKRSQRLSLETFIYNPISKGKSINRIYIIIRLFHNLIYKYLIIFNIKSIKFTIKT